MRFTSWPRCISDVKSISCSVIYLKQCIDTSVIFVSQTQRTLHLFLFLLYAICTSLVITFYHSFLTSSCSLIYPLTSHHLFLTSHLSSFNFNSPLISYPSLFITHNCSNSSLICSTRSVFPEPFTPLMDERETLDHNSEKSVSELKSKNFYIWRVPCEYSAQLHRYIEC